MKTGIVFDIREFAIHDGPGIRTTVFLKGCPLRCTWCHNPEGQSYKPQTMKTLASERLVGQVLSSAELAARLNRQAGMLRMNDGGVTFSGGEPLSQAEFVAETIDQLDDLHVLLDTSGCGSPAAFELLLPRLDLVFFDLKLIDPQRFHQYTGGDIQVVLLNLDRLRQSAVPVVIRLPLVPGVTDTTENIQAVLELSGSLPNLIRLELLPYNRLAGAKYPAAGMPFNPGFDENLPPQVPTHILETSGVPWRLA